MSREYRGDVGRDWKIDHSMFMPNDSVYVPGTIPMKPQEIEELLAATEDENPKTRKAALIELCPCRVRSNHEAIWDRLLQLTDDEDSGVRSIILHNLCDGSPRDREDEVVAAIEKLAQDEDLKLRRRARNALAVYRRTGTINTE